MLTPVQCRMARAALDISARDLARQAGISAASLSRFENGQGMPAARLDRLAGVLVAAGIVLLPASGGEGVGLRLGASFRRDFVFDREGRQVATIVGSTVVDGWAGHPVGVLRGEEVFTLGGQPVGILGGNAVVGQSGTLPEAGLRLMLDAASSHQDAVDGCPASGADLLPER